MLLIKLLPTVDKHSLLEQIISFANYWPQISKTTLKLLMTFIQTKNMIPKMSMN